MGVICSVIYCLLCRIEKSDFPSTSQFFHHLCIAIFKLRRCNRLYIRQGADWHKSGRVHRSMWRVKSTCARFGTAAISLDLIRESSQERSSLQVVSVSCLCKLSLQRDCCKESAAEKESSAADYPTDARKRQLFLNSCVYTTTAPTQLHLSQISPIRLCL